MSSRDEPASKWCSNDSPSLGDLHGACTASPFEGVKLRGFRVPVLLLLVGAVGDHHENSEDDHECADGAKPIDQPCEEPHAEQPQHAETDHDTNRLPPEVLP